MENDVLALRLAEEIMDKQEEIAEEKRLFGVSKTHRDIESRYGVKVANAKKRMEFTYAGNYPSYKELNDFSLFAQSLGYQTKLRPATWFLQVTGCTFAVNAPRFLRKPQEELSLVMPEIFLDGGLLEMLRECSVAKPQAMQFTYPLNGQSAKLIKMASEITGLEEHIAETLRPIYDGKILRIDRGTACQT